LLRHGQVLAYPRWKSQYLSMFLRRKVTDSAVLRHGATPAFGSGLGQYLPRAWSAQSNSSQRWWHPLARASGSAPSQGVSRTPTDRYHPSTTPSRGPDSGWKTQRGVHSGVLLPSESEPMPRVRQNSSACPRGPSPRTPASPGFRLASRELRDHLAQGSRYQNPPTAGGNHLDALRGLRVF